MTDYLTWAILFITLLVFFIYFLERRRLQKLPPGPLGLPILGVLPRFDFRDIETYRRLRRQYGDIYSLNLGLQKVVVVCGYEMRREVFVVNGDATSDRPQNYLMKELSENAGVVATSGPVWRELRNFCLRTLRDLGYNKRFIDNRVQEEIPYVLDEIEHCIGQPFDIKPLIQMSISNIVCSIVYGKRYDYQDPEFRKLIANMSTVFEKGSSTGAINFFPFLRFLPGDLFGVKKLKECYQVEVEFNKQRIKDHKTFFNPRDPPRDYIDSILFAQTKTEILNKTQVYHHISEMFAAGTDTTATALRWALLYLIHYPEVQDKMASEIMQVTDGARLPVIADKVNMPYSTAVVTEVLRMGNVAPLSLPHVTSQDFTVAGYLIPKDTTLIPCLSSFTHDADMFPNPHKFDPGRYINSEGFLTGQEKVLAFSLGKRSCLGESLAIMELFLFLTSLVQRYKFSMKDSSNPPSLKGVFGLTYSPIPYQLVASKRD
ncbi:cytochrome P450 2D20-like isoform X1 [Magallana gigas]|uniref:cytochrome P450 2D20-like isoform X1 n=1 Tax=Magallana gigas TaxID=29159 RepID=UPI003340598A